VKKVFVSTRTSEKRVAITENGKLSELYIYNEEGTDEIGNIYVGRVEKVVPGIQAAFINIGSGTNGFIQNEQLKEFKKVGNRDIVISELLHEGQKVLVQLIKEAYGTKGPRLTDIIEITGKFIVYLPEGNYVAVSKKIEDRSERERLQQLGSEMLTYASLA
jgi:ribonuclease G